MADPLNWDEFRIVRAIAEAQSLTGAAERLGLNHSTMFRRLAALEARLGTKLFLRGRAGYRPTVEGEDMVALATVMADTIEEFERRVSRKDVPVSGTVRLAAPHSLGALVMPPICAALATVHPGLHVELLLTETPLDLSRGEADVALRSLKGPPPDGLVGRPVAPLRWAIYAAEGASSHWIAPSEGFQPPPARRWLERNVEPRLRAASASSDIAMAELAARGLGAALLPCFVGIGKPELRRVGEADREIDGELWVVSHERALRLPRVRALFDFVGDELERRRPWFEGERVVDP